MNLFAVFAGYAGLLCSEFFVVRSALIGGSASAKFVVRQPWYWVALLLLIAPCAGLVTAVLLHQESVTLLPLSLTLDGVTLIKALLVGAAFGKIVGGEKFPEVRKMEINDLHGSEKSFSTRDAVGWFFSR